MEASPTAVVPFHHYPTLIATLHNDIRNDELADPLSLPEQLIGMWIHVKRYFEIKGITRGYQLVYIKPVLAASSDGEPLK
jgi:hypothetical protein